MSSSSSAPPRGALSGRRILVLGASGIVGEGIARSCLLAGADVVAPVRRASQIAGVSGGLAAWARAGGGSAEVVAFDFSTREGLEALRARFGAGSFDAIAASLGGHLPTKDVMSITESEFESLIRLRTWSQVLCAQTLLPLVRPGGAYLVATGKLGQHCSKADLAAYTLASSAVYGVVNALRAYAAEQGDGVRVLELRLGLVLRRDEEPCHHQFPSSASAPGTAAGRGAVAALLGADRDGLLLWDDPRLMVSGEEAKIAWEQTQRMLEERASGAAGDGAKL